MSGWNRHKKKSWHDPDIESARRPVPHCNDVPVPVFTFLPDFDPDEDTTSIAAAMDKYSDISNNSSSSQDYQTAKVQLFTQGQLDALVRDLALSKEAAEILTSRLSQHHVLDSEAKITFYRNRDEELICYFSKKTTLCFTTTSRASFRQLAQVQSR